MRLQANHKNFCR